MSDTLSPQPGTDATQCRDCSDPIRAGMVRCARCNRAYEARLKLAGVRVVVPKRMR